MFEKASKQKLRFIDTAKGKVSTEDLWDFSLEDLNRLAISLNKEVKATSEESFISTKTTSNVKLDLQFAIVKRIIEVKLANAARAEKTAATKAKREKILSIIASKQDEELKDKSIEDLMKELEDDTE